MLLFHAVLVGVFLGSGQTPVKMVHNRLVVDGSTQHLVLERTLRIAPGDSDVSHLLWSGGSLALDVDGSGHIYISCGAQQAVFVFDGEGHFLKKIGGPGEGPGEFRALRRLQVLQDQSWVVFEVLQAYNAFSFFKSGQLSYRQQFDTNQERLREARYSPLGDRYVAELVTIDREARILVTQLQYRSKNGENLVDLATFREPEFDMTRHLDQNYWSQYLAATLARQVRGEAGHYAFAADGSLYFANAGRYQITYFNSTGKKTQVMEATIKPRLVREAEKRRATDMIYENLLAELPPSYHAIVTRGVVERAYQQADFPKTKPPINGLIAMEDGSLLVIHHIDLLTDEAEGHIFDRYGQFRGVLRHQVMGMQSMCFKNGQAYALEKTSDEETVLHRYRLRWE